MTETAQPLADTTLEELHERGKRIPLGRIGQPDDIARVVAFLFSDDAAYMTGQSIAGERRRDHDSRRLTHCDAGPAFAF